MLQELKTSRKISSFKSNLESSYMIPSGCKTDKTSKAGRSRNKTLKCRKTSLSPVSTVRGRFLVPARRRQKNAESDEGAAAINVTNIPAGPT